MNENITDYINTWDTLEALEAAAAADPHAAWRLYNGLRTGVKFPSS